MKKTGLAAFCTVLEIVLIACVALANFRPAPVSYFLFYNCMYGLAASFTVPLFMLRREKNILSSVGIKKLGIRQYGVLTAFVLLSIGGQLLPQMIAGETIPWHFLPMGIVPLSMTTFFEEFLFRGFVQSRAEKSFGRPAAILISGLMFSLYHLGYPGFRTFEDLLLLFFVGLGFAFAYQLSGNNLIVSFSVNLPNAFVTYVLRYGQFPAMDFSATIAGGVTLAVVALILCWVWRKRPAIGRREWMPPAATKIESGWESKAFK